MYLEWVLIAVFVVAGPIIFWFLVRKGAMRSSEHFEALAEQFSLQLTTGEPRMFGFIRPEPFVHGTYRGREVSIAAGGRGLQGTREVETVIKIAAKTGNFRLQMTRSGRLAKMKQRDAGKDKPFKTGLPDFDGPFDLRGNRAPETARLLTPDMRQRMLEALSGSTGTLYLRNDMGVFVEYGLITSEEQRLKAAQRLDLLIDMAEGVEAMQVSAPDAAETSEA